MTHHTKMKRNEKLNRDDDSLLKDRPEKKNKNANTLILKSF